MIQQEFSKQSFLKSPISSTISVLCFGGSPYRTVIIFNLYNVLYEKSFTKFISRKFEIPLVLNQKFSEKSIFSHKFHFQLCSKLIYIYKLSFSDLNTALNQGKISYYSFPEHFRQQEFSQQSFLENQFSYTLLTLLLLWKLISN